MSGFEVVGVVLGAIPLVISGLEHYAHGAATLKAMHDYEDVIDTLSTSLTTSFTIYRSSCEELLGPLMLADNVLTDLLESRGNNWSDKAICEALIERLGDMYYPYKRAVTLLHKRINKLKEKLDLNDNMKVSVLQRVEQIQH